MEKSLKKGWSMEIFESSHIEKTDDGIPLVRSNFKKGLNIFFAKNGLCDVNPYIEQSSRDREYYLKNVLKPLIDNGRIDTGRIFDDRKLRFSGIQVVSMEKHIIKEFLIKTGITYFQRFKDDCERNKKESIALRKLGEKRWRDEYAYFSRPIGISVALMTSDKSFFIGKRENREDRGQWGLVSGFLSYKDFLRELHLGSEIYRETKEEFGVNSQDILNYELIGIFKHPLRGDTDLTYLAKTCISRDYFLSGEWKEKAKDIEHGELIEIDSYKKAQKILSRKNLQYATRGLLENLIPDDFK